MAERVILRAEDGMVLTNGDIYGRIIYLAEGGDPDAFHSITEEEYEAIMAEQEAEEEMDTGAGDPAEVSEG